jgi:tripartite-type tricarboxylate transporter receptor subunit TctC
MLPDTPTLSEAGVKGLDTSIWLGLFAPAGTPPAIVARLNSEINKVLQQTDVREKIMAGGALPVGGTAEDFAAFVRKDYMQWGAVVKAADIRLSP